MRFGTYFLLASPLIIGAGIAAFFRMTALRDFFDYAVWAYIVIAAIFIAKQNGIMGKCWK